ncbi:integrase arm-type DNA-binding domain-containing protein [Gemmobacter fulvus]|uniref:Integrase arm-type DNA-binding domain-containing protein n=2 Tax=Gemmobacter fulvus TaxID=2840474 RepID=A0A975P9P8_9RHOB|nr:integrase arm-type DNA-binding domain-containing protein [Gemmobacter fulvus]QWK91997.1 integrase arm-type DNA-binding domain-containing protein [Gemmobacter fulvus]
MPKIAAELGPLDVKRLKHSGTGAGETVAVGGVSGLVMQLLPSGGKTWLLRAMVGGKRREIGIGGYPDVTLAQARERARDIKDLIRQGVDPVEDRKAKRSALIAARRRSMTFADAVDKALAAKLDAFKNEKHQDQWRNTLQTYAMPELGKMTVQEITVQDVLRVLQPIWASKTETASRLRGRVEAVLSWATVAGHRMGDNPARWAGNLKELLPAPGKIAVEGNHPALALGDAPAWFADLRTRDGFGARAVEFAALTAARSGEVRGATWNEIDFDAALWIIPAARIKMAREHRVPLSPTAVAMLEALPKLEGNPQVFPAVRGGQLSDMTLSATMRRIHETAVAKGGAGYLDPRNKRPAVPHGLRSTFRDWVAERTTYPGEMAEVALAHRISNAVEAAYRRGDMVEKRRAMMAAWAGFLLGAGAKGKVVPINQGRG